tara:strand:+ start:262784 stop:263419 length:636 start_codon:yes stop_codon:yes gene_type:complete
MLPATRKNYAVHARSQAGFTLIEALVAGLILAIGVLGIVSLLTMSKVSQHEGIQRVRAVSLADDILERIRRNPDGMAVYNIGMSSPLGKDGLQKEEPDPDCTAGPCTTEQLANHDLWAWERLLDGASTTATDGEGEVSATAALRNVRACIVFDPDTGKTNSGIVDIVLQWQGLKETKDAVAGGGVCGDDEDEDTTRRQLVVSSYVIDETEL